METVITNDDRIAIAEVDYVIHHMNERYLNKVPQNVQDYLTILKKRNVNIYVDPRKPLENQGLKEFALYFLMILNLKYWCDETRRKDILLMLENNQKKYEDKVNNIFESAESLQGDTSSSESSRTVNRPRQIVVTGSPTFPRRQEPQKEVQETPQNQQIDNLSETSNKPESSSNVVNVEKSKTNAIDELADEANAIANVKPENIVKNFFTDLIDKIKNLMTKFKK